MFEKLELTRMAQALAAHAGARQACDRARISRNADTPGYRGEGSAGFARDLSAERQPRCAPRGPAISGPRPAHPMPEARALPGTAAPNGNTVSLEGEMVKAVEVRQQHDMALAIYRAASDVIRASLGRARR